MKYLVALNRITPAGAGKTQLFNNINIDIKDHPRRCGENRKMRPKTKKQKGSPPQVRGKHNPIKQAQKKIRITPAGAGKTQFLMLAPRRDQDHPRRCGENETGVIRLKRANGSPPQVRGKRSKNRYRGRCSRITPAGAGKTDRRNVRHRNK